MSFLKAYNNKNAQKIQTKIKLAKQLAGVLLRNAARALRLAVLSYTGSRHLLQVIQRVDVSGLALPSYPAPGPSEHRGRALLHCHVIVFT